MKNQDFTTTITVHQTPDQAFTAINNVSEFFMLGFSWDTIIILRFAL